jgi:hypothetical protein
MILASAVAFAFFRFSNHCSRDGSLRIGEGLVMCCTDNGRADLGHSGNELAVFFFNVNILYGVYAHARILPDKTRYV